MSHIIIISERIKVITTIQKTAHAMQLISMSNLSRISNKKKALQSYTHHLELLIEHMSLSEKNDMVPDSKGMRPIYIIIASQKGFCGNFNITLFNFIKELKKKDSTVFSCIAVGHYAYDFCKSQKIDILNQKIAYSLTTLYDQAETIFNLIMKVKDQYDSVIVISNYNASIFIQRPLKTVILLRYGVKRKAQSSFFKTEQPYGQIADYLEQLHLKNKILELMLESLRAENGARALSMDSSNRNAQKLLTQMKLEYNKLRQAKVTKELTELSSALLDL